MLDRAQRQIFSLGQASNRLFNIYFCCLVIVGCLDSLSLAFAEELAHPSSPSSENLAHLTQHPDTHGTSQTYECMADHLREAKKINGDRLPLYAELTEGESRKISWILITSETMGIPLASLLESWNKPLRSAGIDILCDDFISMANTPSFQKKAAQVPLPLSEYQADRGWDELANFWRLGREQDYKELAKVTDVVLAELSLVPTYHCMYRHILESIRLASARAQDHFARAREKGLEKEAKRLVDLLVISQIMVLPLALKIDDWSAPLNARGIPIVCQDVPPIPAPR